MRFWQFRRREANRHGPHSFPETIQQACEADCPVNSAEVQGELDQRHGRVPPSVAVAGVFGGIFPTVSYRFSSPEGVRLDIAEAPKGSSYAKHCILLVALGAGNGFKKIPLPAPAQSMKGNGLRPVFAA